MIIDCENNPDILVSKIGDRSFTLCGDEVNESYRHPHHPLTVRVMDREDCVRIDIWTQYGGDATKKCAEALCKLLNQEYIKL